MRFLSIVLVVILAACSTPGVAPLGPEVEGGDSLWRLQAGERFSGLLALTREREAIAFTLLDPTGLTLAVGRIDKGGEAELERAITPARELAGYLGKALPELFGTPGGGAGEQRLIYHSPLWGPELILERMP